MGGLGNIRKVLNLPKRFISLIVTVDMEYLYNGYRSVLVGKE